VIAWVGVRVDRRTFDNILSNLRLKRLFRRIANNHRPNLAAFAFSVFALLAAFLEAHDNGFIIFALGAIGLLALVHVLVFPADMRLIYFNFAGEFFKS